MPPLEFGTIRGFGDFRAALLRAGFAVGGENDEGIFSLRPYMDPSLQYHTGDPETDPWLWRVRVLETGLLPAARCFSAKRAGYPGSGIRFSWRSAAGGKASKNCMPMALFPGWTGRFTGR